MLVLALEAGASAAKALLFDTKIVVESIQQRYDPDIDDGQGRTDTDGVFQAVCKLGKKIPAGGLPNINQYTYQYKNARKISPNPELKHFYQDQYENYLHYDEKEREEPKTGS